MTHDYETEAKLRRFLPASWPAIKRDIAVEFCQARAQRSPDWAAALLAAETPDGFLETDPILQLEYILSPIDLPLDGESQEAWSHHAARGVKAVHHISLDELSDCAGRYLSQGKASSPTLELWLTRKMIYEEMFAFQEEVAPRLERRTFLRKAASLGPAISSLLIILSSLWVASEYGVAIGFALYVVLNTCWLAKQHQTAKQLQPVLKVLSLLQRAYACAMQRMPSPLEVDRALASAEASGAAWPHHLRDLAELAKQRSFFLWA